MSVDTTTPAVVLTLDRDAMHYGGLGAIRSLGRLGVPVYGVHQEPFAPAASSRYLHGRWFWRPPVTDAQRVRDGLMTLAERIGRRSVLIPADDAGALFLAEHGATLRQWFLFPDPPSDLPRRLTGEGTRYQLCQELDIPCVAATAPSSFADAEEFADRVGFPLLAKRAVGWHADNARPSTTVLHSRADLARTCAGSDAVGLILQEHLPRCPSQDYFFHGYCDARSRCRPGYVGIKERCYPAHSGQTSLGRWVQHDQVQQRATELVARLGFRGFLDLDYRLDPRDGHYKLLDFHPRLGTQFRLFQDDTGLDVVVAAHLDLTGRPVRHGSQLPGRRFLVENYDPIAALGYRRSGELNLLSWVTSLRQVDEMAWFARDDLAPFGLMCLRIGARALARRLTRTLARSVPRPRPDGNPAAGSARNSAQSPRYRPGRAVPWGARHRKTPHLA